MHLGQTTEHSQRTKVVQSDSGAFMDKTQKHTHLAFQSSVVGRVTELTSVTLETVYPLFFF